ncbi:MAG: KamA family radical SAM protein [Deltaproteobacteria bacterium]|nr:KamA family radical SAM protein [Deltaproteobacteria bacterium]
MDHSAPKATPPVADATENPDDWRANLREGIRTSAEIDRAPLTAEELEALAPAAKAFKTRAPRHYLNLVDWNDPEDPIRRQVIPAPQELEFAEDEREDPIGDAAYSPVPRLTHRYPDRVLLYPTYHCSLYCRFCFRKESLNDVDQGYSQRALDPALDYIAAHTELREVILTGGDPLMLRDDHLEYLRGRLEAIPHLRLLRLHTRVPVALPQRVTAGAVEALRGRLMVAIVTHFNHPREITPEAADACRRIRESGFMLLNQCVLMRGVNDDAATLRELFQELVYTLGAKPYYLHHCDLTRGIRHFRTSIDKGLELMEQLRGNISGLCQPTYVLDLPGGHGKIPLGPSYVRARDEHRWTFGDYQGGEHGYDEILPEEDA